MPTNNNKQYYCKLIPETRLKFLCQIHRKNYVNLYVFFCIHLSHCTGALWSIGLKILNVCIMIRGLTDPTVYSVTLYYDEYYYGVLRPPL